MKFRYVIMCLFLCCTNSTFAMYHRYATMQKKPLCVDDIISRIDYYLKNALYSLNNGSVDCALKHINDYYSRKNQYRKKRQKLKSFESFAEKIVNEKDAKVFLFLSLACCKGLDGFLMGRCHQKGSKFYFRLAKKCADTGDEILCGILEDYDRILNPYTY